MTEKGGLERGTSPYYLPKECPPGMGTIFSQTWIGSFITWGQCSPDVIRLSVLNVSIKQFHGAIR